MSFRLRSLAELCRSDVRTTDPRRDPDREFWYVDISSVDNVLKKISTPQKVSGKNASVRARQLMATNDVLVATTRPNLNAVAMVPDQYDQQVCSSGFCVLRAGPELDPGYLFAFVQSRTFVESLSELTKGALYPAVTDRQVFAQQVPWFEIEEQRRIAADLKLQLAAVEEARQASQAQALDVQRLVTAILAQTFADLAAFERVRLGDVAEINPRRSGLGLEDSDIVTFVPMDAVHDRLGVITSAVQRPLSEVKKGYTAFIEDDVIFAKVSPCMQNGKHAIARGLMNGVGFGSTEFHVVRAGPRILPDWIHYFLRQQATLDAAQKTFNGAVGLQRVPPSFLENIELPLPDLDTQHRIAADLKAQLTTVQEARQAVEARLREIERLPQHLLAQVFGDPAEATDES